LLEQWLLIEADLHQVYGVDARSGVLRDRSWTWLRIRLLGLLSTDSRVMRHFTPSGKGGR
jgi:hypothetical protein